MPKPKRKRRNPQPSEPEADESLCLPQTAPLQIRYYGDPVLRKRAQPIQEIDDAERQLAEDMLMTLYSTGNGIGLAATQVGILKRLIIINIGEEGDEDHEPLLLFNPEILSTEGEVVVEEGCLSMPNITADVKRPEKVIVAALNPRNEKIHIEADGLLARVLQHEIDHLNGVLFIDRIGSLKRQFLISDLKKLQQAERPS